MAPSPDDVRAVVEKYAGAAPANWIRIVLWRVRVADAAGAPADNEVMLGRAVTWEQTGPGWAYVLEDWATTEVEQRVSADTSWTSLRAELDRDGEFRLETGDGPPLLADTALTDPSLDALERHLTERRADIDALVERLRGARQLPEPATGGVDPMTLPPSMRNAAAGQSSAAASASEPPRGRLGRLFGPRSDRG